MLVSSAYGLPRRLQKGHRGDRAWVSRARADIEAWRPKLAEGPEARASRPLAVSGCPTAAKSLPVVETKLKTGDPNISVV
jgi:hypothetical protein